MLFSGAQYNFDVQYLELDFLVLISRLPPGACLCSHSPMFPQPNVPTTALCSHKKNLEMWEHTAVGTSGLIFQNKSGNIDLWEHSFSKLSVKKKSLEMWKHRAVGT